MQPIFLRQLLRYYNTWEVSEFEAYMYAVGIVLCSAINVFVIHPYMMAILHMGMKIRVACCSLIYRKALRLTRTALGETTIGQAVNLLSNDVNRFDISIIFLHYLWIGPLETIIITFFMYYVFDIGLSAIIGVTSLLLFIPLQGKRSFTTALTAFTPVVTPSMLPIFPIRHRGYLGRARKTSLRSFGNCVLESETIRKRSCTTFDRCFFRLFSSQPSCCAPLIFGALVSLSFNETTRIYISVYETLQDGWVKNLRN